MCNIVSHRGQQFAAVKSRFGGHVFGNTVLFGRQYSALRQAPAGSLAKEPLIFA
jgi:hypothetical protein